MTWRTILSRSRPPPRGPFRSSAGAPARRRRRKSPMPSATSLASRRAVLGRSVGRAIGGVDRRLGTPKSVPDPPSESLDDLDVEDVGEPSGPRRPRPARSAAHTRAGPRTLPRSVLPERDQPGQSSRRGEDLLVARLEDDGEPLGLRLRAHAARVALRLRRRRRPPEAIGRASRARGRPDRPRQGRRRAPRPRSRHPRRPSPAPARGRAG